MDDVDEATTEYRAGLSAKDCAGCETARRTGAGHVGKVVGGLTKAVVSTATEPSIGLSTWC